MSILSSWIKEVIERSSANVNYIHLGMSLIYLMYLILSSPGLIFVDKTISCIFFEQIKSNTNKAAIEALDWTLICTLKRIVAVYYNIMITYERYSLNIILKYHYKIYFWLHFFCYQTLDRVFLKTLRKSVFVDSCVFSYFNNSF